MTQLAQGNFTGTEKKASGGPYKGLTFSKIAEQKINNKLQFILGTNATGKKVFATRLSKTPKVSLHYIGPDKKVKEENISKFLKDPDFGGGKGSGGGAADTAWTESLQCYYTSLLYNGGLTKLTNQNATVKKLKEQNKYCFTYNKSTKLNFEKVYDNGPEDWIQKDVYIKTANAIYTSQKGRKFKGKRVYFHRGSPFMQAIYKIKNECLQHDKKSKESVAPGSFNDDKWNPGDIWMSTLKPDTKGPLDKDGFCPCEFTDVREAVFEAANTGKTLGVSLKKVESPSAKVQEYNTPKRTHNKKVKYEGFTFGQTGDFFNSIDAYLYLGGGKMQLRATQSTKSWQGEMKGTFAAAGKIGGGNLNYYTEKNFKKSIGRESVTDRWSEIKPDGAKKMVSHMHKLYQKYNNKQLKISGRKASSISLADFKELIGGTKNPDSFYFSKYMCLLFLDTIYTKPGKLHDLATDIVRYAASNTDISSFYIKVS